MKFKSSIIHVVVFLFLVWVQLDISFSAVVSAFFGGLFLLSVLVVFVLVIFGKSRPAKIHSGVFLAVYVAAITMSNVVNSRLASDSIDKGNLLVEKLEMFHKGHGVYPGQLTDINGITEDQVFTDMGLFNRIPFFYSAKGSDYNLSFPFPGWMLYTYENKSQKWYLDD